MKSKFFKIGVVGLGYVGLPLACELSDKYITFGFDVNKKRIEQLKVGFDLNSEITKEEILKPKLFLTDIVQELKDCNIYIIAVPTPIYKNKHPNLTMLKKACNLVGKYLKPNDIVIFESTVYPGTTEEVCIPILENSSNLLCKTNHNFSNNTFGCGYSPERVNPGDKNKKITDIMKITSGHDKTTSRIVDELYKSVIKAGTFNVETIKIAEAAKIIENTQRDINIALINEFSKVLNKMGINSNDVLNAAKTKWNFLDFQPGLVGGHCIGVDPYYLVYKAKKLGISPNLILEGRNVNEQMYKYIAIRFKKGVEKKGIKFKDCRIIIFGFTFKENCKDIRNTGVLNLFNQLKKMGARPEIHDPFAEISPDKIYQKIKFIQDLKSNYYDGGILAVKHNCFLNKRKLEDIKNCLKSKNFIFDLKNFFPKKYVDDQL